MRRAWIKFAIFVETYSSSIHREKTISRDSRLNLLIRFKESLWGLYVSWTISTRQPLIRNKVGGEEEERRSAGSGCSSRQRIVTISLSLPPARDVVEKLTPNRFEHLSRAAFLKKSAPVLSSFAISRSTQHATSKSAVLKKFIIKKKIFTFNNKSNFSNFLRAREAWTLVAWCWWFHALFSYKLVAVSEEKALLHRALSCQWYISWFALW